VTSDWRSGPPTLRRLVAFGVVLGASALVRPFALPLLVGLVAAVVAAGWGWRHAARCLAVSSVAVAVVLTPWTIRNLDALDAFVPFSTNLGDTVCMDRSLEATGRFSWAAHEGCADPALDEVTRNRESTALAIRFVLEHPTEELRLVGRRFRAMMAHDHSGLEETESLAGEPLVSDAQRDALSWAADVYFAVVALTAAVGVVVLARSWRARPARPIFVITAAFLLLIPLGLWGNPRFHVPLLPFLAVAAAGVGVASARRVRHLSTRKGRGALVER
jgi:hypothetical protein